MLTVHLIYIFQIAVNVHVGVYFNKSTRQDFYSKWTVGWERNLFMLWGKKTNLVGNSVSFNNQKSLIVWTKSLFLLGGNNITVEDINCKLKKHICLFFSFVSYIKYIKFNPKKVQLCTIIKLSHKQYVGSIFYFNITVLFGCVYDFF